MTVTAAVAAYLAELAEQRRQSPHTVAAYRRDLEKLLNLAGETPLQRLGGHQVRQFLAQLHGAGLAGRSLARHLSAWRGFFAWLGRRGEVVGNPCDGVKPPRSPKRLPKALSADEAARLLEEPGQDDDPAIQARDRAMFELFYSSGLRLAELVGLQWRDLELMLAEDEVRVTGKRGKTRIVPVGRQAREALLAWRMLRDTVAGADEAALFVGRRGRRIHPRVVEERLEHHARQAGLPRHVHPHMLRHSFASHVLQSSGDLRAVQEMLGHASIAATQIYTHLDFQHLAKSYDAAHPRAKKA